MEPITIILTAGIAICGIVAAVVCYKLAFKKGIEFRKKEALTEANSAEAKAKTILADAQKSAETAKKEALLSAKDESHKLRQETERELKERRGEINRMERRLAQKEETIDRKTENIEKKEDVITEKIAAADERFAEAGRLKDTQMAQLERVANLTTEQAKAELLSALDLELDHEKAQRISIVETNVKDVANEKAKEYISLAINRLASDYVTEYAVSSVPIASDELKGRIIGREGRNIRTLEQLTGGDFIVDDTPEAITISCHDPVRREIARRSLEKLITDGRIHPARIEETVEKVRAEVDNIIKAEGEKACLETKIPGIHPEMQRILGRLKFRTSYGQNVLNHSMEVAYLSGLLAAELGVDQQKAKRAGLLHDIGKALNHEIEGSHVAIGVEVAKKFKESLDIIHAIEAHHGDVEAKTALACIVAAADAISAARPGARREDMEAYIARLKKLEEIANAYPEVEKSFAIQAGREIRVIVSPQKITDDKMQILAHDIAQKIEAEMQYPGQVKVNLIRESRAQDIAK